MQEQMGMIYVLFCTVLRGCVVWGRDLKESYRHLMINPAYWWCTGTTLNGKFSLTATAFWSTVDARGVSVLVRRLSSGDVTKYSSRRTLGHARRLPGGCVSETG